MDQLKEHTGEGGGSCPPSANVDVGSPQCLRASLAPAGFAERAAASPPRSACKNQAFSVFRMRSIPNARSVSPIVFNPVSPLKHYPKALGNESTSHASIKTARESHPNTTWPRRSLRIIRAGSWSTHTDAKQHKAAVAHSRSCWPSMSFWAVSTWASTAAASWAICSSAPSASSIGRAAACKERSKCL